MKRCAIYVPSRHYGQPGQCQSRSTIKRIEVGDTKFLACATHRRLIVGGRKPELARGRR